MSGGADLDEATLQKVAKMTVGHYFRASDQKSLERIYAYIDNMTRVHQDEAPIRPQYEYYPWFLASGLLVLFVLLLGRTGLRWRGIVEAVSHE